MRMILIKQGANLQSLASQLLVDPSASDKTLETMKRLNPHIDFERIAPGSVLLVPDAPGLQAGQSSSVAGEDFAEFTQLAVAGLDTAVRSVKAGYIRRRADQQDVLALLQSDLIKKAMDEDAELKTQVDAALKVFSVDETQAKSAEETLAAFKAELDTELEALAQLLG